MSSFYIKHFLSLFIFFKLNLLSSFDIDVYSVYSVMFIHSSMTKELAFFNKIRLRCYNRFFFKNLFKYLFYFYLIIYTNNRTQNKNNSNNQTLQKELLSTIYILKSKRRNSDGKSFCLSILFSKGTSGIQGVAKYLSIGTFQENWNVEYIKISTNLSYLKQLSVSQMKYQQKLSQYF